MIKTHNARHKTQDAFTLIEILITLSIFSIIILGLYSTFHTGLFSYNHLEKSLSLYQTARKIINRMDLDLKNVLSYNEEETKFSGEKSQISFLTLVGSNYSLVSYKKEENNLLRLCKKGLESLKEDSSIKAKILTKNLKEINFSYGFIENDKLMWKDKWPDDKEKKLPLAVKIELVFKERDVKFEKFIFLPLAE